MKWRLDQEQQIWDLDYMSYEKSQEDVFAELMIKERYKKMLTEFLPLRQGIADKVKNIDDTKPPEVELKLQSIIGRKSFNRRNNLFYDYDERLIYVAGCNLVITTIEDDTPDDNMFNEFKKFKGGAQVDQCPVY